VAMDDPVIGDRYFVTPPIYLGIFLGVERES